MTIFGAPWEELELEHVQRFLDGAGPESLLWEAKGTEIHSDEVRVQVCGFANSHDGGYLILGATESGGTWALDGIRFRQDPPVWISDLIGGDVTPYPDGLDTRSWRALNGRQVAIVWVPPSPTPPCNTRGRVFERVSGKTIPVTEPLRLAALFERGDQARRMAEAAVGQAAVTALARGTDHPTYRAGCLQFGLGLAAVGYLPDISSRLFSRQFEQGVVSSMTTVLTHDVLVARHEPPIVCGVTQNSRSFETRPTDELGLAWSVEITWDGALGIYWTQAGRQHEIDAVVDGPLREAWQSAEEILGLLKPRGPRYLQVAVTGGRFGSTSSPAGLPGALGRQPTIAARGPLDPRVADAVLASIKRELQRATNEMAYEATDD